MHSQLRERIRLMRARLDNAAPVAEIRAESQLFVTPAPVCDRLVTLAEISNRDHILEPSAGTGAILRAIRDTAPEAMCDAVEINSGLVRYLRENFNGVRVQCGDFMEWHCCKVSDEAAFCLIQRPYISKTLLTRRISPRGSP
ncbi:class I SAM-dependent methyltransferase [Shigella flexneri]|nr:class I SAM-dependent methyltransferase [Shigella flexneri]